MNLMKSCESMKKCIQEGDKICLIVRPLEFKTYNLPNTTNSQLLSLPFPCGVEAV